MSYKGDKSRVQDRKAWDECPLWDKIKKKKEAEKAKEKKSTKKRTK